MLMPDEETPVRAVLYARISSAEKAPGEMPISDQLEACRAYACWKGYDVVKERSDDAAGSTLNRKALNEAKELVAQGEAGIIVCYHPDHLATDDRLRAELLRDLALQNSRVEYAHPPVNLKLGDPTAALAAWPDERSEWIALNRVIGGHPLFHPLTIKAAYVVGVVHQLCECVTFLLRAPVQSIERQIHPWLGSQPARHPWQTTYVPAFSLFGSAVNLLGRCLRGNDDAARRSTEDIEAGFKWLHTPRYDPVAIDQAAYGYHNVSVRSPLINTSAQSYTIEQLVKMRHYSAHGQAVAVGYRFPEADYEILAKMPGLLAVGLEHYWAALVNYPDPCDRLARANIVAYRGMPILASWIVFSAGTDGRNRSITEIFRDFDWKV